MESTSYGVFPLFDGVFLPCDHGLFFLGFFTSSAYYVRIQSINQSIKHHDSSQRTLSHIWPDEFNKETLLSVGSHESLWKLAQSFAAAK